MPELAAVLVLAALYLTFEVGRVLRIRAKRERLELRAFRHRQQVWRDAGRLLHLLIEERERIELERLDDIPPSQWTSVQGPGLGPDADDETDDDLGLWEDDDAQPFR